jgi:hypothetical protein
MGNSRLEASQSKKFRDSISSISWAQWYMSIIPDIQDSLG